MANLLIYCIFSQLTAEDRKENDCAVAMSRLKKNIDHNRKALEDAGYGSLLALANTEEDKAKSFYIEPRPDCQRIIEAARAGEIKWKEFIEKPDLEDYLSIFFMPFDLDCATELYNSWKINVGSNFFEESDLEDFDEIFEENLKHLSADIKLEKMRVKIQKKDITIMTLKAENESLKNEIASLKAQLKHCGISNNTADEQDIDLSDVADVEIPSIVLYHFRQNRALALRYLKGCRLHNSPSMARNDYKKLGKNVIPWDKCEHGFKKRVCDWLNFNGCDFVYNAFK